jgi:signal transduction histidine kinase
MVEVRLRRQGQRALIEVVDQGPGISEADRQKLFQRFSRLSARPTAGESSNGLGLSIVKRLVEGMNGSISCESTLGNGTAFIVSLGLAASPTAIEESPPVEPARWQIERERREPVSV